MSSHGVAANATSAGRNEPMRARKRAPKADELMISTHRPMPNFGLSRSAIRTYARGKRRAPRLFDHLVARARASTNCGRRVKGLAVEKSDHRHRRLLRPRRERPCHRAAERG